MAIADTLDMSVNCLMGKCLKTPEERAILSHYRACGRHGKSIIKLVANYESTNVKSGNKNVKRMLGMENIINQ